MAGTNNHDGTSSRLAVARGLRGVTQGALAKALGVSQPRISQIERLPDTYSFSPYMIHRAAVALRCGPSLLAFGDYRAITPPTDLEWDPGPMVLRMGGDPVHYTWTEDILTKGLRHAVIIADQLGVTPSYLVYGENDYA